MTRDMLLGLLRTLILLLAALASPANADGPACEMRSFRLVTNAVNAARRESAGRVSAMFLRQIREWPDGTRILPVDLPADSKVRDDFSRAVHGRPAVAIHNQWLQSIFSGRGAPPTQVKTEEDVVAYVAKNKGAIGYIACGTAVPQGLRVLEIEP